jgi:hypothetical protein
VNRVNEIAVDLNDFLLDSDSRMFENSYHDTDYVPSAFHCDHTGTGYILCELFGVKKGLRQ